MPARKKARVEAQAASPPSVATPAPEVSPAASPVTGDARAEQELIVQNPDLDPDLWTDEQEITLFKGLIKWKPVGMHKRFRMISLSQHLRSHGHRVPHTRPQGLWAKLDSLYNLKTLDEREDAFGEVGSEETDALVERFCDFKLPDDEFGDLMFDRRLDHHKASSPAMLSATVGDRASTVDDTEEPRSSAALSLRGGRNSRRGRGSRTARGRSKLQNESTPRGRGKPSPVPGAEEEDGEDEEEGDEGENDGEEENDDEEDDEEEEEEEEEEEADVPTPRGSRARGRGSRGRGARGGRRGRKRG